MDIVLVYQCLSTVLQVTHQQVRQLQIWQIFLYKEVDSHFNICQCIHAVTSINHYHGAAQLLQQWNPSLWWDANFKQFLSLAIGCVGFTAESHTGRNTVIINGEERRCFGLWDHHTHTHRVFRPSNLSSDLKPLSRQKSLVSTLYVPHNTEDPDISLVLSPHVSGVQDFSREREKFFSCQYFVFHFAIFDSKFVTKHFLNICTHLWLVAAAAAAFVL